ncbi:MAG: ribonuclease Z [Flavobacteriales bacterium]|nr:ribonuclease Z [Flavobacteriales bacterium]
MTKFSVLILGSASASPTLNRNPTSQLVNINEQYYLIDCGEGTQSRLRAHKIKFQRLHHIFISHLHGDHYLGLIGLLQTMHLLGRTIDLHLYGPPQLKEIIDIHLKYSQSSLRYPLIFHPTQTNSSETIFENEQIEVSTLILNHRIPCTGFLFKEKNKPRKINPKAIAQHCVPKYAINGLKKGEDYIVFDTQKVIKNEELTLKPAKSRSYAFCSDTKYSQSIVPIITNVDLLYHEATFMQNEEKRAKETYHSTASQAAQVALEAKAKLLIIGHFSNRYLKLDGLLAEAKTIFENTELALENSIFEIEETQ